MRLVAALLVWAFLVIGCSTTTPTPGPTPTVIPTTSVPAATASAPPTAPSSTDFSSSELCPGGTGHTCRLADGEHHSLGFGDGIAFTLQGQWTVDANETDLISLETGLASNPSVLELITGAIRFQDPVTGAYTAVADPGQARTRIATMDPTGYSTITVTERAPMTLGGAAAVVFDITSAAGSRLFVYPVTQHASTLLAGRTARFIWTTWDGAPFIVSIESDSRSFDEFVDRAQRILDSLALGDGG